MPRKPRITLKGYYHIINRGVERRRVFTNEEDFRKFETLLCKYAKFYNITLHSYSLMSNHYHLLIEINNDNLSKFMRQVNMNYAIYFNKNRKRSGHLWQGRFKSVYVTDEAYLYSLILYIEQNPIKARMVKKIQDYRFQSLYHILNNTEYKECLKSSFLVNKFKTKQDILEFINTKFDKEDLAILRQASNLVEQANIQKENPIDKLEKIFKDVTDKKQRNELIYKAYVDGYSQHQIAKVLNLSQPTVFGIIKRVKDTITIT